MKALILMMIFTYSAYGNIYTDQIPKEPTPINEGLIRDLDNIENNHRWESVKRGHYLRSDLSFIAIQIDPKVKLSCLYRYELNKRLITITATGSMTLPRWAECEKKNLIRVGRWHIDIMNRFKIKFTDGAYIELMPVIKEDE